MGCAVATALLTELGDDKVAANWPKLDEIRVRWPVPTA
jgi:hypothetical protein